MASKRRFTRFNVGDMVTSLPKRRAPWQSDKPMRVVKVHRHGFIRSVGHNQTLILEDGRTYSGWWFDPKAPDPFSK